MSSDGAVARRKHAERVRGVDRAKAIRDDLEKLEQQKKEAAKAEEDKAAAAAAAAAAKPRKIFVSGDVSSGQAGGLSKVIATVKAQTAKVGAFDALFCVGSFMPDSVVSDQSLGVYLRGEEKMPIATFFIDGGSALLKVAPGGHKMCEKMYFLGGYGIREIQGLRVAFLSGRYNAEVYNTPDVDFVGGAFTVRAVNELKRMVLEDTKRRGIDLLLTCAWPADIDERLVDETSFPPELPDGAPWQSAAAPPVSELSLALEPRYHLFGAADLFYQRPPFQTPRRGHFCRCIGLGRVGSASKQRKWLHALSLAPMAHMSQESLKQVPGNVTPCPFAGGQKRSAPEHPDAPAAKRAATSDDQPAPPESEGLAGRALSSLLKGDMPAYREAARQLEGAVVECGVAIDLVPAKAVSKPTGPNWEKISSAANWGLHGTVAANSSSESFPPQAPKAAEEEEEDTSPGALARRQAATEWLQRPPAKGVVRYTFDKHGPLGIRLSKDVPPWIIEVRDGTLAAQKAPRVPLAGIVLAVNGYDLAVEGCQAAIKGLAKRPVVIDVEWPLDQGALPTVSRA